MRDAGVPDAAIEVFAHYHQLCATGVTGIIHEESIRPLLNPPSLAEVDVTEAMATEALAHTVMIKLNGGLGTSMGLDAAKTLLPVRDGKNFLDITVDQVRQARRTHGVRLPLLFMNSFRTREDTLAHLAHHPDLAVEGLPLDFLQNKEPKLDADDLSPIEWPADETLEWCPPGHGDIYVALWTSGLLDTLLAHGYRYANLANGDNLGAAPNAQLAGWFAQTGAPYAAEVCPRTSNDRKGGHLAIRRADGRLILRDSAQTTDADQRYFQDETTHPFFHANNLWLDLQQLRSTLVERHGVLGLPLIRNEKTVDPQDAHSPRVIQLESAMGAAIEVFDGALAIEVGRDRFLPVKTTNELLLLRSDVFELADDGTLRATSAIPTIDLASTHYKLIDDFDSRVRVVPSLRDAVSLRVEGDWVFGQPTHVVGDLVLPDTGRTEYY
ncbi:MAG TPA: UTP--glucose-1-phosphate uridylyltransferase [Propionibacteriaceae bacterium]|nr:UTP--glucose-1-phosphate uridylyltransferase [Propionibacteriaceae bacterium]